jgi:hypothetical protein
MFFRSATTAKRKGSSQYQEPARALSFHLKTQRYRGRTVEEKRWQAETLKAQKCTCGHCGAVHTWPKKDVVLGRPVATGHNQEFSRQNNQVWPKNGVTSQGFCH